MCLRSTRFNDYWGLKKDLTWSKLSPTPLMCYNCDFLPVKSWHAYERGWMLGLNPTHIVFNVMILCTVLLPCSTSHPVLTRLAAVSIVTDNMWDYHSEWGVRCSQSLGGLLRIAQLTPKKKHLWLFLAFWKTETVRLRQSVWFQPGYASCGILVKTAFCGM